MSVRRRKVCERVERDRARAEQYQRTSESLAQLGADIDAAIAGNPPPWLREMQAGQLAARLVALDRWRNSLRKGAPEIVPPAIHGPGIDIFEGLIPPARRGATNYRGS